MGAFLRFLRTKRSRIKIVSEDGRVSEYEAPLCVKQVLIDHPNHVLFPSVRKSGIQSSPIHESILLKPGNSYFLSPIPYLSCKKPAPKGCAKDPTSLTSAPSGKRRVSFANSPSDVEPNQEPVSRQLFRDSRGQHFLEVLPAPEQDGVVRLKVIMSRKKLEEILEKGGDATTMIQSLVAPLLDEARNQKKRDTATSAMKERTSGWKPNLDCIDEGNARIYRVCPP